MTNEQITTAEQLDALPTGTVILDRAGDALQQGGPVWYVAGGAGPRLSTDVLKCAPLTVIYRPDQPTRRMSAELVEVHPAPDGERRWALRHPNGALTAPAPEHHFRAWDYDIPDPEPEPESCPEWSLHDDEWDLATEVLIPAWGLKDGDLLSTPDGWQPVSDVFAERDDYISFDLTGHQHVLTTFDTLVVRRG